MSRPVIIRGGLGSGKTEEVVERLAALYESDPFYEAVALVPTSRHGDQLRRRLVSRCGVALRLRVETIPQFSQSLASGAGRLPNTVAEELLVQTATREVECGPAFYFRPIARTEGFVSLLNAAIHDLLSEAIEPRALREAADRSGSPPLMALSAIFAAYCSELDSRDWLHPAQTPLAAAKVVKAGTPLPDLVLLDGFHLFRGVELRLLEAIARRSDVIVTFDPESGARARYDYHRFLDHLPNAEVLKLKRRAAACPETVTAGSASDREDQLRAIARQIKQRLTENPSLRPSDCAVAFRQVQPHLGLARQVFSEYDLPLDPAAGERLGARPLGVWLRRLLHLARDGWCLRDLAAVLSSGFIDLGRWGLSSEDVARFQRQGRKNHLWAGQDALKRIADTMRAGARESSYGPTRDMAHRIAVGTEAALEDLRTLLEQPPSAAGDHARRLDDALFGDRALVRPASRNLPGVDVEIDSLRGHLRDLTAAQEVLGGSQEPFESFTARLERKLDSPAVLLREAGGVLLAPMHTLHSLRFDYVALGGLIEGEFPAQRTGTTLLDSAAREALNKAGLALPPEPRLAEDELWATVSTRADAEVAVWKTRLNDRGRPAAPSYYFDALPHDHTIETAPTAPEHTASRRELAIACTRLWHAQGRLRPQGENAWQVVRDAVRVEQSRRSFGHGGAYEGRLAAGLVPRLTGENAVWSASRLESYRTCAFQFFSSYALRLRELEEEMDSADAAMRGTVIHEVLQDALEPLVAQGRPLTSDTLDASIDRLRSSGLGIWNRAPEERGFGRAALWRLEAETVFEQLEILLQREAGESERAGVTRIIGAEKKIEASLPLSPHMRVTATVDRLDEGEGLVVIVDYKSGRPIPKAHVVSSRRVQLQLYGYLAREEASAERIVARYAWLNPGNRTWDLDSSRPEDQAVLENVIGVAQEVRSAVASGDFRVNPQVQPCPSYCSFKHICRVNEYSRWKRWD